MSNGTQTFGNYLKQFGLTIDIVDNDTFNNFMEIIEEYVKNYLKIDKVSLKNKTIIDEKAGLREINKQGDGYSYSILRDGEVTGQTAYAFLNRKSLWVIDRNKKDLKDPESRHVDLWNGVDDLPQSFEHKSANVKTSIIVPIIRSKEAVGVVEFGTMQYIEPTTIAKKELERIADTISRVQYLHRSFTAQNNNTQSAIKGLRNYLKNMTWPELTKPQIFVAFPADADKDVVGRIKTVLNSFSNMVNVIFWDEINESGKVDQQIIRDIAKSQFGVCYFSEPAPEGSEYRYVDNTNVIFEAGMFQSLTNSPGERPIGWVPIREKDSPPPPFDYGSERILIVERLDESLNKQAFESDLTDRIKKLLETIEP